MSKKILKNIIITIILALFFVAIAFGVYILYHRTTEDKVVSEFIKNLNEIRKDGNYRLSYVLVIEENNFKIERINETTHKNGFTLTKAIRKTTNSEGVQNIDENSIYYSDGVEYIYVNNIEKLYRLSEDDGYTYKSISEFSRISSSLNTRYNSGSAYEEDAWKFDRIGEFDGQKCYILSSKDDDEWLYLSKETYLPIGMKNNHGYICKCKFEVNPEISDAEVERPDLSDFSRVEYVKENDDEYITNVYIYAPDGTVTKLEDTRFEF